MEFRDKPMENLIRLQEKDICKNARALLLDGESIVGAYKTVRDQVIFTTHRIIMVDMRALPEPGSRSLCCRTARCCTSGSRRQALATRCRHRS